MVTTPEECMSLAGRWTRTQVDAIRANLHDWLIQENLHLVVIDITCFGDSTSWFMLRLKEEPRYKFDELFGHVRLTIPHFAFGQQPQATVYERYDREGRLVELRKCPPTFRIDYSGDL